MTGGYVRVVTAPGFLKPDAFSVVSPLWRRSRCCPPVRAGSVGVLATQVASALPGRAARVIGRQQVRRRPITVPRQSSWKATQYPGGNGGVARARRAPMSLFELVNGSRFLHLISTIYSILGRQKGRTGIIEENIKAHFASHLFSNKSMSIRRELIGAGVGWRHEESPPALSDLIRRC